MNLSEIEKAYLAGIFDGEGCVGYYKRKGNRNKHSYISVVMISQSDMRLMHWVRDTVGFGTVYGREGKKHFEYHWETNKRAHVYEFLTNIRPYLVLKAEQVDTLLALIDKEGIEPQKKGTVTIEMLVERDAVYRKLRDLKVSNLTPIH